MLVGDASTILASATSIDRNLNGCGYCKSAACGGDCTIDSPATDAKYTPNAAAPNWDYRVVYEVWVSAAAFAGKGFGGASISFVHASPSKASTNTVTVVPRPCGGDGCPEGTMPVETPTGKSCKACPEGTYAVPTSEGISCMPGCPGGTMPVEGPYGKSCTACPVGTTAVPTSEGSSCMPGCPVGSRPVTVEGSTTCVPCPEGQTTAVGSEGAIVCVPITIG
jgi:hypothetical protein